LRKLIFDLLMTASKLSIYVLVLVAGLSNAATISARTFATRGHADLVERLSLMKSTATVAVRF
jgi:hypothetical protein